MLMWAYGSNLNPRNMRIRCPAARRVGPLEVEGGALVFRAVADVTTRENSRVPGGVWRITKTCERELDRFEGVRSKFYRKRYLTLKVKGVTEECLYYQMHTKMGIMPPAEEYLQTILQGYEYFDLDQQWLDLALHESWNDKKITPMLRARHIRKGRPPLAQREDWS